MCIRDRLLHDGSGSQINNSTGYLVIQSDDLRLRDKASGHPYLKAVADGAVELYYDNVKTFNTVANGIQVRGTEGVEGHIYLYADEGDDYADLWLLKADHVASGFYIQNKASGSWEDNIKCFGGGAVELYWDNAKKLETYQYGVTVTGNVQVGTHAYWGDNGEAIFGAGSDMKIFHSGSNAHITHSTSGALFIDSVGHTNFRNAAGTKTRASFNNDGGVELYYNNVLYLNTYSGGVNTKSAHKITGLAGGNATLLMYADNALQNADYWKLDSEHVGNGFTIASYASGNWQTVFKGTDGRSAELHYQDSKKLETTSGGVTVTGDLTVVNNLVMEDSDKIKLGGSADLEIFFDGTNGYMYAGNDGRAGYVYRIENQGNNNDRYGIRIQCGKDDSSGTNYAIGFGDGNNTDQGYITFSGGTVTYGAFTAHHPCIVPDSENPSDSSNAYPYGTLLETISIEYTQKDGADTERGIRYKVQKTQSANSKKVLGAYGSSMNGGPSGQTNEHQALVLGDGHILVNNAGGNIEVGDGICSSATAGIGQKATANPSMIIGIAQEAVTFTGTETKLVAVQYGLQQFTPWS